MERREFLKFTLGFTAAAGAIVATAVAAQAAPMLPAAANMVPPIEPDAGMAAEPAIATQDDIDSVNAEQVQWRRGGRRGWRGGRGRRVIIVRPRRRRRFWRRGGRVIYY